MSSLKALLNSKSFESVTTSNLEITSSNGRKRGAVLEEWLLRKFPELYRKSHDLESTTVTANDVENQPLSMFFVFYACEGVRYFIFTSLLAYYSTDVDLRINII